MSGPVHPENAFSQSDPNPEGEDVDPDFLTDDPSEQGVDAERDDVETEDQDLNDLA